MAIKTRNCLKSAELARQQALKTRYCLSSAELARRNTIKITNCLNSAELARQQALQARYCLISAELALQKSSKTTNCLSSARARPTETANRLSTVLSPAPTDLSLARQSKHTPKKYTNCLDSCLSPSFSAKHLKQGVQNIPKIFTTKSVKNKCKYKRRGESWKVRPIVNLCQIIIRRQLIIPASTGTKTRVRLKKVNKQKTSQPKLARGKKPPNNTPGCILATNLTQVKVTPFPIS
jgi:hypothetical protein